MRWIQLRVGLKENKEVEMEWVWAVIRDHGWMAAGSGVGLLLAGVAIYDVLIQKTHTILHNFPVVGHLRYWLETIGPELRQYWVANHKEDGDVIYGRHRFYSRPQRVKSEGGHLL